MPDFDLPGLLRRIRRIADLSQRELAQRLALSKTAIGAAEAGTRDLPATLLARAAALAGLRLTVVDDQGCEVAGMADDTVRDMGYRRFPAHLDTRYADESWWHGEHRRSRSQPWYTFDRDRWVRDTYWRRRLGTPEDHQLPQPGDSPEDRAARRKWEALRRRAEERERRFLAGELRNTGPDFECICPPACDPLVERTADVHVDDCPCQCDVA
jgi:DNA-binding XRE family transcriptional regulator